MVRNPHRELLERRAGELYDEREKLKAQYAVVEAARIASEGALETARLTANRTFVATIIGSAVAAVAAIAVGWIAAAHSNDASTVDTQAQNAVIDCTDERQQVMEMYKENPQILVPYSGPQQEACDLNAVLSQLSGQTIGG